MTKKELIEELKAKGIRADNKMSKKTLTEMLDNSLAEHTAVVGNVRYVIDYKSKGRYFTTGDYASQDAAKLDAKKKGINDYQIREVSRT